MGTPTTRYEAEDTERYLPIFAQFETAPATSTSVMFPHPARQPGGRCAVHTWNHAQLAELERLLRIGERLAAASSHQFERTHKRIRTLSRCLCAAKNTRLHDAVASELEALLGDSSSVGSFPPWLQAKLGHMRFRRLGRWKRRPRSRSVRYDALPGHGP